MKVQFLTSCIVLGAPVLSGEVRDVPDGVARSLIDCRYADPSESDPVSLTSTAISPDPSIVERERKSETRVKRPQRRAVTARDE
jgi:hypothetical protein